MENPSTQPPPIPRLRVTRRPSPQFDDVGHSNFLPAGPSLPISLNDELENFDDDDAPDAHSTPKISLITSIPPADSPHSPTNVSPEDTPAARLRALLSRLPNNSGSTPSLRERAPTPPSEVDSDFDPPQFSPQTPSLARESVKDIFSKAMRDTGDTPPRVGVQNRFSRPGSSLSSKSSSIGSQADYHDRIEDLGREANVEREREWNKPHLSRSTSSLSSHSTPGRSRTHSHSGSHESVSEHEQEVQHEIEHGRERNWNAPHPKWDVNAKQHGRPLSPMPSSLTHSASSSNLRSHSHSQPQPHSHTRVRAESLHTSSTKGHANPRKSSPSFHQTTGLPTKPMSPLLSPPSNSNKKSPKKSPASGSRFGLQFPRSRTPLSPFESDDTNGENKSDVTLPTMQNPPPPRPLPNFSDESSSSKKSPQSPDNRTPLPLVESDDANSENKRDATTPAIPNTPPPPPSDSNENSSSKKFPASASRFGWQIPQSRLPPFELDDANGENKCDTTTPTISNSPLPPLPSDSDEISSSKQFPASSSRFGWQIPQSQTPLPPFELHDTNDENKCDATVMKTPRPPGSWSTPAPWPLPDEIQAVSVPVAKQDADQRNGLVTPAPSLSRAGSLPSQTPVPPGGWMATPSRKSILKVRFDVEPPGSDISATENGNESTKFLPGNLRVAESEFLPSILPSAKTHMNGDAATPAPVDVKEEKSDVPPPIPPQAVPISPRSLRKPPSIRLVDAFGRESKEDANGRQKKADVSGSLDDVFRSGTAVRIVDAMGREVEDVTNGDSSKLEDDHPLKHNEALARVRQGLADLANGFNDGDRSSDETELDRQLVTKLEDESRGAREIRKRLSQTLLDVQSAEDNRISESKPVEANMRKGSILANIVRLRHLPWNYMNVWTFWGFATLQVLLAIIMYRISTARARNMFLTRYYDPFYADLHLYIAQPDTLHYSLSSSYINDPWSIFSIVDAFQHEGWLAAVAELWNKILALVSVWQSHTWETWGADSYGQKVSWPPT